MGVRTPPVPERAVACRLPAGLWQAALNEPLNVVIARGRNRDNLAITLIPQRHLQTSISGSSSDGAAIFRNRIDGVGLLFWANGHPWLMVAAGVLTLVLGRRGRKQLGRVVAETTDQLRVLFCGASGLKCDESFRNSSGWECGALRVRWSSRAPCESFTESHLIFEDM